MDGPPPLPDTRDPYVLLGVARDADERTIKKAYARLIKVYRPDRSPEEFDRIHSAYELIRELAGAPVPEPTAAPAAPPAPRPADDPDAMDDIDDPASLDLTWARLRTHLPHDPAAVSAILLARHEAFVTDRRFAQVVAELRDPTLRADGDEHPAVAVAALRAIAALAWRADEAPALLESWCQIPREYGLERLIDRVEHELALARRWRGALGAGALRGNLLRPAHVTDLPDALVSFVADSAIASPRRRAAQLDELDRLLRDPARLLEVCDRIFFADPELAALLVGRFQAETPRGPRKLAALEPPLFDAVGRSLVDLEKTLHAPVRPWMLAAGAVGGAVAAAGAVIPIAIGAGVALGSAGLGSMRLALSRRRYVVRVRPGLAAIACRLGVQSDVLREWLSYNKRLAGDLATYDIAVAGDAALALLAALAATVREHQRGPEPDED